MSDPQEAATPSDPHSAEAEARYPDPPPPTPWDYMSPPEEVRERERDAFIAGRVSRDAEVAELREAYENWKSNGQAMHAALLEIWHSVTAWDTSDMTFGDDPQSVVKAVRESASAEVAELKAKIAGLEVWPAHDHVWDFNGRCLGCASWEKCPEFGSASSPVEGGN